MKNSRRSPSAPGKEHLKVCIIATHPIQYHIPWYRSLASREEIDLTVYYALLPDSEQQGVGFGISFDWDIPMLEGYRWEVLPNTAANPSLRGFWSSSIPSIHRKLAQERPDAVVITGWQALPLLQALWACIRLGIPLIIRGESNSFRSRPWRTRLLHRLLLSRFDAFLAIGKGNRDFYLGYGVASRRIFPCRYFVDNQRFAMEHADLVHRRDELRAGWGIPAAAVCFLYVGKLEPKKRILDLLQGLEQARHSATDLHLLVVGTGELEAAAKTFVTERNLPVTFAGFLNQTEIVRAYTAADCLVLPSDYGETWGLVVNEGMVCGLPAIVSDRVGCGPDLVENGVTGFTFPFGDTSALAERLLEMAADRNKIACMAEQVRERVSHYSVENAVAGTLQAVRAVLTR